MTDAGLLPYAVPKIKCYGAIEDVTKLLVFSGTGDLWSAILEEHSDIDPPDGCGPLEGNKWLCPDPS